MAAPKNESNIPESKSNASGSAPLDGAQPATESAADPLPRRFERLVLLKHLARGGMGEVYLAATQGIEGAERPCVVKIVRREHTDDTSFNARFLDETRIQAQLQHPGVAQVLEASTDRHGKPYCVVEYVEGRNLGELRARSARLGYRLSWPDAVAIAVSLGEAMAHVHERTDAEGQPLDIVHRDLSPQNVMVGYGGDLKLIDFGTARGQNRRSQTVAGVVFAKPGYVAPEVAQNTPGGVPADLYAFGIILWELLAGRRFIRGETKEHLEEVAAGRRRPTPVAAAADAPAALDEIIERLTAVSPEHRYLSAAEATAELVDMLKLAPTHVEGQRSVRGRIERLMRKLYPAEPGRSRSEFARLVQEASERLGPEPASERSLPVAVGSRQGEEGLLPGTRYQLLGELGRGGMGVVHEALHIDLGRRVALKLLPESCAHEEEFAERFRTEARAIACLSHPGLVKLHDFGMTLAGQPYYAMELLEGESLDARLRRDGALPWSEAFQLGIAACRALNAAHEASVCHCDIKPANLFACADGTLKLLDFGVARMSRDLDDSSAADEVPSVIGTPDYMSPEQARGRRADARSDVYALGATLYELVTGYPTHPAEDVASLLDAKQRQEPTAPTRRAPQRRLPKVVDEVILKTLEVSSVERYQSADELADALERALAFPAEQRRRRRARTVGALTVALSSAGLLFGIATQYPDLPHSLAQSVQPGVESVVALAKRGVRSLQGGEQASQRPQVAPAESIMADAASTSPVAEAQQALAPGDAPTAAEPGGPQRHATEEALTEEEVVRQLAEVDRPAESGAEDEPSAAPEAPPSEQSAEVERRLAQIDDYLRAGLKIRALSSYRRLGKQYPEEPRVLAAWTRTARELKGWGEALKVAERWAKLDSGEDAWLELARLQRATGHRGAAVHTLELLLVRCPQSEAAHTLLEKYRPRAKVALQERPEPRSEN